MHLIFLTYTQPIEVVDQHLAAHREFLDEGYARGLLLASGPMNPRTGGVILAKTNDKYLLEEFIRDDPFFQEGVAEYQFIEFNAVKMDEGLRKILEANEG